MCVDFCVCKGYILSNMKEIKLGIITNRGVKITKQQAIDIELSLFFCPKEYLHNPTPEEVVEFFDWSERGIRKTFEAKTARNPIILGKSRRGLTMGLWEGGVLDGTLPYFLLLGGFENNKKWWQFWKSPHKPLPRFVVDFMKKEMFRGIDKEVIERAYQMVNNMPLF